MNVTPITAMAMMASIMAKATRFCLILDFLVSWNFMSPR